jgi:predicted O-methyltransferase YrrM
MELNEIVPADRDYAVRIAAKESRHGWSLGAAEQIVLQLVLQGRQCLDVFEIGTFNGGTTKLLAESLPDNGRVWTIDLPPAVFDATQAPDGFSGTDVGSAYRHSPKAHKIHQLFGDSATFDFAEFEDSMDLVLVDGGHEYPNGVADSRTALRLVRPGGVVLWDDFQPYWHGLVRGICDAMETHRLCRLAGTSFAVFVAP